MGKALRVLVLVGWGMALVACDPAVEGENPEGKGTSVVPMGRGAETSGVDVPTAFKEAIEAHLQGEGTESMQASLEAQTAQELWSVLQWLPTVDVDDGQRAGFAAVVLSHLVDKEPREVARYLASDQEVPFGLAGSSSSLLPFREAMTRWAAEDTEEAFAALASFEARPGIGPRIEEFEELHGERLEVTLAGAMPLDDWTAVTARWDRLEGAEVGSLMPRLLERTSSLEERDRLMDRTAIWLGEQWESEGPAVIFEWALGLGDADFQKTILDRVPVPEGFALPEGGAEGEGQGGPVESVEPPSL